MASAVLRSAAIAFGKRQAQRHVARCFSTTSMPKAELTLDDLSVDAHNMDVNAAAALYKEHGCVVVRGLNLPYVERVQSGTKFSLDMHCSATLLLLTDYCCCLATAHSQKLRRLQLNRTGCWRKGRCRSCQSKTSRKVAG